MPARSTFAPAFLAPWLALSASLAAAALAQPPAGVPAPGSGASTQSTRPKVLPRDASVEQILKIGVPVAPMIMPDGSALVRERHQGVFQVFRREPGAGPAGKLTRLTNFADGVSDVSLSPDGRTLLVEAARGGSEQTRVYRVDPTKAPAPGAALPSESDAPLLGPEGVGITSPTRSVQFSVSSWLKDSSGFFYRANAESTADFYLYRYDLATGQSTPVLKRPGSWSAGMARRDGSRVLVTRFISASQSECYELDIASGTLIDLTLRDDAGEPVASSLVGYLPGEQEVLIVSDYQRGRDGLWTRPIDGPKVGVGGAPMSRSDVLDALKIDAPELDQVAMSLEGDLVVIVANDRGYGRLALLTLPQFAPVPMPEVDALTGQGLTSVPQLRDRRLVFSASSPVAPGLSYSITIDPQGTPSAPERLTTIDDNGVDMSAFVQPALVEITSFDGTKLPAWVFMPPGRAIDDGKGPVPFIVEYHGGPEGQSRPGFNREAQIFASRGIGVMYPNVRGSTGYGRAFQMMDNYTKRWDSVKDGVACARWLVERGLARAGHIASRGTSYGGYMCTAVLIEDTRQAQAGTPRLFGAGMQTVGITNFRTFLGQTADYRRKLREAEYGPMDDAKFMDSISPLTMIDQVQAPMMIVHGLNDPRVPIGEAMQLALALQKRGMDPEILFYPDEGHGLSKTGNRVLMLERALRFVERTIAAP